MVTRFFRRGGAARLLASASIAVAMWGCAEPPLVRSNPNDALADFELSLVASRDTVSAANPVVVLRLVSDPPFTGYEPVWSVSSSGVLVHEGQGVFRVVPGEPTVVTVTARFFGNGASRRIVRVP